MGWNKYPDINDLMFCSFGGLVAIVVGNLDEGGLYWRQSRNGGHHACNSVPALRGKLNRQQRARYSIWDAWELLVTYSPCNISVVHCLSAYYVHDHVQMD